LLQHVLKYTYSEENNEDIRPRAAMRSNEFDIDAHCRCGSAGLPTGQLADYAPDPLDIVWIHRGQVRARS